MVHWSPTPRLHHSTHNAYMTGFPRRKWIPVKADAYLPKGEQSLTSRNDILSVLY